MSISELRNGEQLGITTIQAKVIQFFSNIMILKSAPSTPKKVDVQDKLNHPRFALLRLTINSSQWIHCLVQAFFDWLTGYYITPPLWHSNSYLELLYGIVQYFGGLGLVILAFVQGWWLLISVGACLSVAGAAQLQEIAHFCVHNAFFSLSKSNKEQDHE